LALHKLFQTEVNFCQVTEITFSKRFRFIIFDQSLTPGALIICNETCSEVCRKLSTCAVRALSIDSNTVLGGGRGGGSCFNSFIGLQAKKKYIFSSAKPDNKYVNYSDTSIFIQKSSYMFDVHRAVHRM